MDTYVLPTLFGFVTTSVTFDLWMGQSGFDNFALVMNFIDNAWVFKHVTISFFETPNTIGATVAKNLNPYLLNSNLHIKLLHM